MYEEIKEPVDVVVIFKGGQAFPYSFRWRGRKYPIDQVNLLHQEKRGNDHLFCFSVSALGNLYRLSFDSTYLVWSLEQIWTE